MLQEPPNDLRISCEGAARRSRKISALACCMRWLGGRVLGYAGQLGREDHLLGNTHPHRPAVTLPGQVVQVAQNDEICFRLETLGRGVERPP